ncbi:sentrin-specific protease 8 [Galleria mellonella]|uniref:Sentrin-specific protease 8 n=1 Tax=Galleria mellonella TaxID=7137 RepID=A0A6J1WNC3_GALME|nr:sentrin-specific protease 8 [Galleria mellonella]
MAKASVVLSFHEILLHKSDVDLLDGPYWLNDTIISFYFEYLERVLFSSASELLFISPEVTQCIKMVQTEEIKTFLEPLGISKKNFVFFALNDNDLPDRAGGSHWSLLVYSRPESCFFHFDSSSGSNHNVAWEFASHLITYFSNGSFNFVDKECLQQSNGYDCGVHVISNTERLAEYAHNLGQIGSCEMLVKVNPIAKRRDILSIIKSLANCN